MNDIKIKPCPFCGKSARLKKDIRYPRPKCNARDAFEVVCENFDCPIYMADNSYYLSEKAAIEAWNRRVTDERK